MCIVAVELDDTASGGYSDTAVDIGTITVNSATTWEVLEDTIRNLVMAHFAAVGEGVRNRRSNKNVENTDSESDMIGLGLSFDSVREIAIGG